VVGLCVEDGLEKQGTYSFHGLGFVGPVIAVLVVLGLWLCSHSLKL